MRTSGLTASGLLLGVFALAATPATAQPSHDPENWGGLYLGVSGVDVSSKVRGLSARGDGSFGSNANDESADDSFRGAGVGLLIGYQRHYANGIIVGLETDGAWLRQEGREDTLVNSGNAWNGMTQASILRETQWISTARLRLGYAWGPFMLTVTGGLAIASLTETRTQFEGVSGPTQTVARFSDTDQAHPIGWTWGVGGAWRINDAWSLRLDYLRTEFDEVRFSFPDARGGVVTGGGFASVQGRSVSNDVSLQMLRLGLTYTFGTGQ